MLHALALAVALAAAPVPPLTGPVVDAAGVLDGRSARALEQLSRAARAQGGGAGPQLQYLLVRTTEGEDIADYSIRVAEAWKIGTKGRDDGVLVVVAIDDHRARIEVGGGLEGALTDAQSGRIIRNAMAPAFREQRYGQGLYDAGVQILSALGALPKDVQVARRTAPTFPVSAVVIGLFLLVFVFRILGALGPRRSVLGRRGPFFGGWGGPFGGGGWGGGGGFGGGGGGGGGWSGGGGGFSGGGASGDW